ncbi:MAG: molybdenum cofactor biosynthesis protein MoaE [Rhizobiaceae bacterium]
MAITADVRIQSEPFDTGAEIASLSSGRRDNGALVTFSGICRDEAGTLAALEIEHYPGMAEAEISRIAAEAAERWPVTAITVIHRHGRIVTGDPIVLVMTVSEHRQAAFAAAEFMMDFLKSRAPFWKKEHRVDGSSGEWVDAKETDEKALTRWE